jgi:hypothetical protein
MQARIDFKEYKVKFANISLIPRSRCTSDETCPDANTHSCPDSAVVQPQPSVSPSFEHLNPSFPRFESLETFSRCVQI